MASKKRSPFVRTKTQSIDKTKKKKKKKTSSRPYGGELEHQALKRAAIPEIRKSKAHKEAVHQYSKERKRIQRLYHDMIKRGYTFEENPVPPTVEKIRRYSPRKIRELARQIRTVTPRDLYSKARLGELSGLAGLKAERSLAAKKASETRARKKAEQEQSTSRINKESEEQPKIPNEYKPNNEQGFNQKQSKTDKQNKERMELDRGFAGQFRKGEYVYLSIDGIIDDTIKVGKGWAGKYLRKMLNNEIDRFGYDNVMIAIGQAPNEYVEKAQIIVDGSDYALIRTSLMDIYTLITGTIPSAQENKDFNDAMDMDAYEEAL